MIPDLTSAQRELLRIADDLEAISFRLRGVRASLPESLAELVPSQDIDEMDPATELRAIVTCVLNDSIEPAIRDLRSVQADPIC